MKTVATVMQLTRSLLILTPAEYDRPEGGLSINRKKGSSMPSNFSAPQIFELNESLKDHPYEKSDELAAFVKRCAESVSMELGDLFLCIEDEDILITKEYKHHVESKDKLLLTYARVEAEAVLHQDVQKYTILNFEYGQQYGKANKSEDVSASLFAMNTALLTDIRANFSAAGLKIVKVTPPIAGMLYTSKVDLNSATRAIAVISMDFAATRLVVLHNGAPVFQQSFSSVLEDIAEMLMLEFGISKLGAIDLIRQKGLGVCNECNSAQTRKQTMSMLDNAAGEILRNLRMVISTLRLDIDQIVLCDALAKIPNIAAYCRQVGLSAPMEKITNIFAGSSQVPSVTGAASQRGFDAVSFITLNGVLSMPIPEANLLQGQTNILTAIKSEGGNKIGNLVAGVLGVVAAVWMLGVSAWWISLNIRENNDTNTLNDTKYTKTATELIKKEATWKKAYGNLPKNIEKLPKSSYKLSPIVKETYDKICNSAKVLQTNELVFKKVTGTADKKTGATTESVTVSVDYNTENYKSFKSLDSQLKKEGFYSVSEDISVKTSEDQNEAKKKIVKVKMTLTVTAAGLEKAKLSEDEEAYITAKYNGEKLPELKSNAQKAESSEKTESSAEASDTKKS